jgi:hypothetical protein
VLICSSEEEGQRHSCCVVWEREVVRQHAGLVPCEDTRISWPLSFTSAASCQPCLGVMPKRHLCFWIYRSPLLRLGQLYRKLTPPIDVVLVYSPRSARMPLCHSPSYLFHLHHFGYQGQRTINTMLPSLYCPPWSPQCSPKIDPRRLARHQVSCTEGSSSLPRPI